MSDVKRYYHGSHRPLSVGTVMAGRGEMYVVDWGNADFYQILDDNRPATALAHRDAVFMVSDPDDIDLAGGATDWALEVEPLGEVTRHDLNWSSEISGLISEGKSADSDEVVAAARSYWAGTPHYNESVWEFLSRSVRVIRCEPSDSFQPTPLKKDRVFSP